MLYEFLSLTLLVGVLVLIGGEGGGVTAEEGA